eukprot:2094220-Rhodomonas_salina.1
MKRRFFYTPAFQIYGGSSPVSRSAWIFSALAWANRCFPRRKKVDGREGNGITLCMIFDRCFGALRLRAARAS